ncbi:tRNA uridine-5-carboxymethylaminomethyl(34) synthesis GTPase MnmE [Sphingomonas nostoxanthinifaciens]|uniref:tRNA uridine-5-carboxymethylaminomethyl(34) synthesis GTPase MnmE n=1 Tax=Sphingomonas nostoxanthinifaciens TaxID=2872652 RepID=UPI001CC21988|nr:tRNA uridine-5-carboxymethylaminomethyl(34) synthesis GTPase MnmE [Sphingomonas nostoxanthinifaciens]UAK24653.1 tRNA uridine-5-carboxymethylaminomethyl(34) synthesis GTPase MnmE [Sphingomonas nostoxanthinifaciens]
MNGPPRGATIFALSSGALPAAIAIVRISGPVAGDVLAALAGGRPEPRRLSYARLRDEQGALLDQAMIAWLPGPATATGEDLAELHLHGGRAVTAAVLRAIGRRPDCRPAEPGEFTRRAFENGRIDLAEAEGLADLLAAETDGQRRQALRLAEGGLGRMIDGWRSRLLAMSAAVEAELEFGDDEADVAGATDALGNARMALAGEVAEALRQPPAERVRDGVRVVIAGPVNAGKSSLLNALVGREAAIATEVPGTTRDLIEVPVQRDGIAFVLIDSAGLRETGDRVEQIGIARSYAAIERADIVLWLGAKADAPTEATTILVVAQADRSDVPGYAGAIATSAITGLGLDLLWSAILAQAQSILPSESIVALNARHRACLETVHAALMAAPEDLILLAEHLRAARMALDRITGRAGTEDMLDALFGRFCIGK